jgi:pyruvate ferredoxin oxidoreductase alpha subunit
MHEMLFVASGSRVPIIMAIANRALSSPLNINGDQSDSMAERDYGWIQINVENAQEAYDTMLQAFRVGEHLNVQLPVIVGLDGFIVSHTLENVNVLSDEVVKQFVGERAFPKVLNHEGKIVPFKLDPENPMTWALTHLLTTTSSLSANKKKLCVMPLRSFSKFTMNMQLLVVEAMVTA